MRLEPFDQPLTLVEMFASAPSVAMPGVSVLPSSVMSGPPLPLVRAVFQSVVRLPHGIQSTTTLVLLYCGNLLWNCETTPFIHVTWDGTDPPMRHTTSLAGADEADDELLLEPQPAMPAAAPASATAAPNAAADLVKVTDRSPFPGVSAEVTSSGRTSPAGLWPDSRHLRSVA